MKINQTWQQRQQGQGEGSQPGREEHDRHDAGAADERHVGGHVGGVERLLRVEEEGVRHVGRHGEDEDGGGGGEAEDAGGEEGRVGGGEEGRGGVARVEEGHR